jgi:Type II secretion system (T2SS), protein E, N-terminal domain
MPNPHPSQLPVDPMADDEPIRLGDRLIEAGLITRSELDSTLESLRENGLSKRRLGRTLVDLGFLSDRELTKILGVHFGIPVATFSVSDAEPAAIKELPAEFARRHRIIPCRLSADSLSVAAPGPLDAEVVNEIGRLTKHSVVIHLASERDVEAALAKFYPEPGAETAKHGSPRNGPPLVAETIKPAAATVTAKPAPAEKRPAAIGTPISTTVTLQDPASAVPPPIAVSPRISDLQERAQRYAAQTRQFTAALQRITEDNEQLSVEVGNLQREWETLHEHNARLQQEADRARDDNLRLRKELERARKEKERVMEAVAKFSEEVLTWGQSTS